MKRLLSLTLLVSLAFAGFAGAAIASTTTFELWTFIPQHAFSLKS